MRTAIGWVVGVAAAAVLVWGLLHVAISPVNPAQEQPSGHVTWPCWTCHFVSESVDVREP